MPKPKKPTSPAQFVVDDQVHVKSGITDPDFPDMPLGGWTGTVKEIAAGSPPTYLVRWNRRTLQNIHPVFKNRCEIEGLEYEEMWLGENDLEPDTGQPMPIKQPTKITTKPLSPKDQDDRLRAIFGLTSNDPIPEVDEEMLLKYHKHLAKHLSFPFPAKFSQETGPLQDTTWTVTVTGLVDPEEFSDEFYGLFCEGREDQRKVQLPLAEINVAKATANQRLLDDYSYWFWNWR